MGLAGAAKTDGEKLQRRLIRRRREHLRDLLRGATQRGVELPWGEARLGDFVDGGEVPSVDFFDLDEELPGDNAFTPLVIE